MKTLKFLMLILLLGCFSISSSHAQEMKAKKHDNPQWVRVAKVKFKPMTKDKAVGIIHDYFMKSASNAGQPNPKMYHMTTGEYDILVVFPFSKGLDELNYETTDDDIKWMGEMIKITGSQEKAMGKLEEFYSYVTKMDSDIARVDQ